MPETKIGIITHYFGKLGAAIVKATEAGLTVGVHAHEHDMVYRVT